MSINNLNEGQDSFLDIIANLVGVLIILVVIVGAQATTKYVTQIEQSISAVDLEAEAEAEADAAFEEKKKRLESELTSFEIEANKFRLDRLRLEQQANDEKRLAQELATRRHAMLIQLETVRAVYEKRKQEAREKLSDKQQKNLELQSEKIRLVSELESLEETINAVSASRIESTVETIDHFPNPIAKTVFSNEVHFRLDRGRIVHVPMDELVERMKGEIRLKAEKLKQADGTRETIGPIDGFRLQYELGVLSDRESGDPRSRIVRFKRFIIQPTSSTLGESVETALADSSKFSRLLSRHEPRRTTVSIWVYPNSFAEHAQIKDWLHERGYQMASWPLSQGRPISGGPDGFRTSAQ